MAKSNSVTIMPMENDNGLAGNVVVTAEQATKINETDGRLPENRQSGVVLDASTGSERGEQGDETVVAVAVAVAVEENGSNLVGELPPRFSSARVPFINFSQIDADLALARMLQEQSAPHERKERRPWTPCDDVLLISSWLNTNKDPVIGNEQKGRAFWTRIAAYYASSPKATSREHQEASHCKQRWHRINDLVCKFRGAYEAATREKASGQNENDVLKLPVMGFDGFEDSKRKDDFFL